MPTATAPDGVELYYEIKGNPDATNKIILVMGMGGSHLHWAPQTKYFSELDEMQVLIMDNRGAAFSHSPPPPYNTCDMADDVIFLADLVNFKKFHLVGVSMGGMISLHIALKVPERILSFVIMASRATGGFFSALPTFTGIYHFYRMKKAHSPELLIQAGLDLLFPHHYLEQTASNGKTNRENLVKITEDRNKILPKPTQEGQSGQMAAVRGHGLNAEQLHQIKSSDFPILSIVGDYDVLVKPHHSFDMPGLLGSDLVVIEGAGHGMTFQCADLINHLIHEFIDNSILSNFTRTSTPVIRRFQSSYAPASKAIQQQVDTPVVTTM